MGKTAVRIYIQMDHASESMRYVARAMLREKCLHETGKYGDVKARDEVFRMMVQWLEGHGYTAPDHYWQQTFPN